MSIGERGARLRASACASLDLVYGPRPRNRIDLFASGAIAAPLVAFIHGGYWQRNAKEDFACMAIGPLARGCDVAVIGYTLAPEADLTTIAAEIQAALRFLRRRDAEATVTRPFIASGWSAGGHLAALALGWPEVDAALAISGIFDLEPMRGTRIDDLLDLTEGEIRCLSPIRHRNQGASCIVFGGAELPELRRQSSDYHAVRVEAGLASTLHVVDGADHFSVLDGLMDPSRDLTQAVLDLLRQIKR